MVTTSRSKGTGALKSGFTRTGKRTVGGILDDGYKSVLRYYLNNFQVCEPGQVGWGRNCEHLLSNKIK